MALQRQLKLLRPDSKENGAMREQGFRVAFASADLKKVDQHFGSAERFAIYAVEKEGASLIEVFEFGQLTQDGNENKLLEKFVALEGCLAVYCLAVGPSAVRQLISLGIQPMKVQYGTLINNELMRLQQQLHDGPTGWLARALTSRKEKTDARFDLMEEEGWCE